MDSLINFDRQHLWHPFTQITEWEQEDIIVIDRGEGNYLYDNQGNKYFDGVSSLWVNVFGHCHPKITGAIQKQAGRIAHSTFLGLTHEPAILLGKKLLSIVPLNLNRIFYSDNGATAVEVALKMSLQSWRQRYTKEAEKKTGFISFHGAYHGDTIGAAAVGGIELFHKIFSPMLFSTVKIHFPNCYRCPYEKTYPSCNLACADDMERQIAEHHENTAAFIIEPMIQGANGMVVMPPGYLSRVKDACSRYNVHLIADEVATGFGKTGKMFACEHEDIQPDFLCLAKGITGGYLPLAATLTTEDIFLTFSGEYNEYKTFFHGHSYTANPLGCAAGIATLGVFEEENIIARLRSKIDYISEQLERFKNLEHVGDIRQCGVMTGIELVREKENKEHYSAEQRIGHKVILEARKLGLIIRPLGNVIVVMPPLSVTMDEIDFITDVTFRSIETVTGN